MQCCGRPNLVETNEEVVCQTCGRCVDQLVAPEQHEPLSKVSVSDEGALGSQEIAPRTILNSRRHANILRSNKMPKEKKLADACTKLNLHQSAARRGLHIFRRLMDTGVPGTGEIAFFSIFQACREFGVHISHSEIKAAINDAFSLHRPIKPQKAIFRCESIIMEHRINIEIPRTINKDKDLLTLHSVSQQRALIRLQETFKPEQAIRLVRRLMPE